MGWFGERKRERERERERGDGETEKERIEKKKKSNEGLRGLMVLGFILYLSTKLVTLKISWT